MKTSRFWIEIVALGTAIACALALVIATLGAAAVAVGGHPNEAGSSQASPGQGGLERTAQPSPASSSSFSSARQQAREGMVTCSRCGAKHSAALGKTAVNCSLTCVHSGATFALVDGDKTYMLDGATDRLKKVAGQRARIMGVVQGNRIKVSSVAAAS